MDGYDVLWNTTKVGQLYMIGDAQEKQSFSLQDTTKYAWTKVFSEGSTNAQMGI
jgi:hypothetical protein